MSAEDLAPIDYAARWRALVAGRDDQRGADYRDGDAERDPWRKRAGRFATYSNRQLDGDPLFDRLRAMVRPEDTVLDVGAGAGRYAALLAPLVRRVVAVEPSPAMRQHLAERLAASTIENVSIVAAAWPEAAVEAADVVLCSHVVYGVREIAPFMRALDDHARRVCLVSLRVDQHPGHRELSRELFGVTPVRQPALLDLYPVLGELGIVADVQIDPTPGSFRFADHEAALAHYRDRLNVPTSLAERLHELLAAQLVQAPEGYWRWPGPPPRNAIVSWAK